MSGQLSEVMKAMGAYEAATKELDRCRKDAGYEAGYFCRDQANDVADALERLDLAFGAYLVEKVGQGATVGAVDPHDGIATDGPRAREVK